MASVSGGNKNRQKMINLMYLVFIAMVALNVSSEVLEGFDKVEQGLDNMLIGAIERNNKIQEELQLAYKQNPGKAKDAYKKGNILITATDSLYSYLEELKLLIVKKTDGEKGDVNNIDRKDDMNASSEIMLNPISKRGQLLHEKINKYSLLTKSLIDNEDKKKQISQTLSTEVTGRKTWEEQLFESMPTIAAVTLLTKLQTDIRGVEGEVLNELIRSIDFKDIRVNKLEAQVIPQSKIVMRGSPYNAQIVLTSIDSTAQPKIVVNGKVLAKEKNGIYTISTYKEGTFPVKGYIETKGGDGSLIRQEFHTEYTVTEPMASIAPMMMNVLYAGIDNPINIAVPGIATNQLIVSMENGSLQRKGQYWIARPKIVEKKAVISVAIKNSSKKIIPIAQQELRVRSLPDPLPFLECVDAQGKDFRFKGGRISKRELLSAKGIGAAIDDDILNVSYSVISFQLTFFDQMGNAIPEVSNDNKFSKRQKSKIRSLSRGKRFYISEVVAKGPDGIERKIPPIEVIVK